MHLLHLFHHHFFLEHSVNRSASRVLQHIAHYRFPYHHQELTDATTGLDEEREEVLRMEVERLWKMRPGVSHCHPNNLAPGAHPRNPLAPSPELAMMVAPVGRKGPRERAES